jgi:hypothetical protein
MAMWLSKSRLVGTGLAAAAVAGVAALTYAAVGAGRTLPRLAAERGQIISAAQAGEADHDRIAQARDRKDASSAGKDRDVHVTAPNTDVDVDKERGNVRVRAPYTKVDVNPDRGQVRVRAPHVNLDIRW